MTRRSLFRILPAAALAALGIRPTAATARKAPTGTYVYELRAADYDRLATGASRRPIASRTDGLIDVAPRFIDLTDHAPMVLDDGHYRIWSNGRIYRPVTITSHAGEDVTAFIAAPPDARVRVWSGVW